MKGGMPESNMKVGGATRRTKVQEMNAGGLAMVEKGGKKVPFYAADGVGKMNMGGKIRGYGMARGGKVCKMR